MVAARPEEACMPEFDSGGLRDIYGVITVFMVKFLEHKKRGTVEPIEVKRAMKLVVEELIYNRKFHADKAKYLTIFMPYIYHDEANTMRLYAENPFMPRVLEQVRSEKSSKIEYRFIEGEKAQQIEHRYNPLIKKLLCTDLNEIGDFVEDNYPAVKSA